MVTDQFGMIGLLTFIRAAETEPNLVTLALGRYVVYSASVYVLIAFIESFAYLSSCFPLLTYTVELINLCFQSSNTLSMKSSTIKGSYKKIPLYSSIYVLVCMLTTSVSLHFHCIAHAVFRKLGFMACFDF